MNQRQRESTEEKQRAFERNLRLLDSIIVYQRGRQFDYARIRRELPADEHKADPAAKQAALGICENATYSQIRSILIKPIKDFELIQGALDVDMDEYEVQARGESILCTSGCGPCYAIALRDSTHVGLLHYSNVTESILIEFVLEFIKERTSSARESIDMVIACGMYNPYASAAGFHHIDTVKHDINNIKHIIAKNLADHNLHCSCTDYTLRHPKYQTARSAADLFAYVDPHDANVDDPRFSCGMIIDYRGRFIVYHFDDY